jgi:hypothetical protein
MVAAIHYARYGTAENESLSRLIMNEKKVMH